MKKNIVISGEGSNVSLNYTKGTGAPTATQNANNMPTFSTPPPQSSTNFFELAFPNPHTMLVLFTRPKSLNCINIPSQWDLHALFDWYDAEPTLRCAIVTGSGRAFSAGADLKEWDAGNASGNGTARRMPPSGFGALSRRTGKKPVVGAINGLAYGGGCEIVTNLDINVMSASATVALPEVKRGVVAIAGALPRIVRTVGRQRAMEMALTGRVVSAQEALSWGLVNEVVSHDERQDREAMSLEQVLERPVTKRALEIAEMIAANSPDAVIISREGIKMGWEGVGAEEGTRLLYENWERKLGAGDNMKEGVRAFVEKRAPRWRDSKL